MQARTQLRSCDEDKNVRRGTIAGAACVVITGEGCEQPNQVRELLNEGGGSA